MTVHMYFLLAIAALLIGLGLRLLLKYQKSPNITYFSLLFFGLAMLSIITAVIVVSTNDSTVLHATRLGYFFGVVVFSMMLMFSWYYPIPSAHAPRHPELFWVIPLTFFFPFIVLSTMTVQGIERSTTGVQEIAGSGFVLFPVFVMLYVLWSLWNLVAKMRATQGSQRNSMKLVILGLALGAAASLVFDAILPLFGHPPRHYISIEVSSVLIGVTAFIATRR